MSTPETYTTSVTRRMIFSVRIIQSLAWLAARFVLLFAAHVEVRGREHLKGLPRGVVFASNHMNDVDAVLVRTSLPLFARQAPLFYVARSRKDYIWRGWKALIYRDGLFNMLGALPAHKGTRNYAKSLELFAEIGTAGRSIAIFTGGQQQTATEPVRPRGGTGYLAWVTKSPVVPVAVEGTYDFSLKQIFTRPHIIVQFGAPLYSKDLFNEHEPQGEEFRKASAVVVREIERMRKEARGDS